MTQKCDQGNPTDYIPEERWHEEMREVGEPSLLANSHEDKRLMAENQLMR
jgi:hypothetical protein